MTPTVGELGRYVEQIKNRDIGAVLFLKYNDLDRWYYPRRGNQLSVSLKRVFQVKNEFTAIVEDSVSRTETTLDQYLDPFFAFELYYKHIFPLGKKFSLITDNAFILTTLGSPEYNITDYYFIGGFNPIFNHTSQYWGASDKEYISPNYFYTELALQFEVFKNTFVTAMGNYVDVQYPMEFFYDIQVGDYLGGEMRRLGYGLSVGYNSPFGPISFSAAKDSQNSKIYTNFNLGFWFK
jgi:outer membrane protein assembly factor BamA